MRVSFHPQGAPNVSKQKDSDDHHSLHRSLTDALNLYETFTEPRSNTHQFDILEELIEYLVLKFNRDNLVADQLAYPDMAIGNFCGTYPG